MNFFRPAMTSRSCINLVLSNVSHRKAHAVVSSVLQIQPLESRLQPIQQLLSPTSHHSSNFRFVQTASAPQPNLWQKFKTKVINRNLSVPKQVLILSGYKMYICLTDQIDFAQFVKAIGLPDTFNSWFLLTQLHVWLCMVKLSSMGEEGKIVRNNMVHAMWKDLESRGKQLGKDVTGGTRRQSLQHFNDVFRAALFNYDEGLLGDDRILAASLWRMLFEMNHKDPEILALMVEYVRKQVHHIEQQDTSMIFTQGLMTFLPLYGDTEDKDQRKRLISKLFNQRVML